MSDTIELNGRTYRVDIEADPDMGAPWEEHDGHGIVSDWTTRDKRAGELVLHVEQRYGANGARRFYDLTATIRRATSEGWGLGPDRIATLASKFGRAPTKREIVAEAVRLDYEYLRGWCNDEWYWAGVRVTDITDDENAPTDYTYAVWGFDSNDDEGHAVAAQDLAEQAYREYAIAHRFADAMACGV